MTAPHTCSSRESGDTTIPLAVVLVLAVAQAVGGCSGAPTSGASGPPAVDLRVTEGPLVIRHLLTGELFAEDAVELVAPNAGIWPIQIRQLAESGSEVAEGEPVVEFDNSSLIGNLDQQRTVVVTAETRLATTRTQKASEMRQAEFEVERLRAELEKKTIAADIPPDLKAERDYQKLQLDLAKADLDLRQALSKLEAERKTAAAEVEIQVVALEKAIMSVQRVEQALDQLSLVAPKAGIIEIGENRNEDRVLQAGDSIQPGLTVARIPDLSSLRIRAQLFDVDDLKVEPGLTARVTLDAYPGLELGARVRTVQGIAHQASGRSLRRAFEVILDLDQIDLERMRSGMSAKIEVERIIERDAAGRRPRLAPRQALDLSLPAEPRAALRSGELRDIDIGPCNDFHCVVNAGLEPGERLADLADPGFARDPER